jgi:YYY domain-containing protein
MEYIVVLRYLVVFGGLTALGAPIAALLFAELPRRGAAFALPTALIPLAVAVFWIGQVSFGLHAVLLAVGLLAVGAALSVRRGGEPNWRAVAAGYGVFAVGFLVLVTFRSATPAITPAGGEQFLHFGLVSALERAPDLPPEDFWFAGEPLKYYYGTQLQVTSFSMLTGTELRYGFNLGIAAFYGVLCVVAYGLAGALVAARGHSYRLGGTLGAALVAFGGPTTTPIRLLTPHLPESVSEAVAPAAFGFVADRFNGGDLARTVAELSDPFDWGWWFTRYVVPGTIQEVPLYSFVKADLHGHSLSTGFVLFAGAVGYAYYTTPEGARARRAAIILGGLGAIAGVFGFMNTWALPTAGGVAALAVAAADPDPATLLPGRLGSLLGPRGDPEASTLDRAAEEFRRVLLGGVAGAAVVLVGVVVASPFLIFGHVPSNEGVGFFPPRSQLGPFLVIYVGLLLLFATYLLARARPLMEGVDRRLLAGGAAAVLLAALLSMFVLQFGVLAATGPLLVGGWLVARERGDYALVLLVAGVGLLLALELVHARLPMIDPPRWNTALKVAVQGWTLAAAGAGAGAAILLARSWNRLRAHRAGDAGADAPGRRAVLRSSAVAGLVVVVLLASLVFPTMVVGFELGSDIAEDRYDPTLDGLGYLNDSEPYQAEAIHWLEDRRGTPTIVESPGSPYGFTSPFSTFTGIPTVVGWDHQIEYRSEAAYDRRVAHVDAIYTGDWADAADYLVRYDVEYVVVGPNEYDRYDDPRAFDRAAFSVAFENDRVAIHAVNQSVLGA